MLAARTVAVVVPSPATSLVLVATSRTICAPMFWKRSARSISLATVTPSLVTVGAPQDFSRTTLRPLGPSVTATASLRIRTPRRTSSRAACEKAISFAAIDVLRLTRAGARRGAANVDRRCPLSSEVLKMACQPASIGLLSPHLPQGDRMIALAATLALLAQAPQSGAAGEKGKVSG